MFLKESEKNYLPTNNNINEELSANSIICKEDQQIFENNIVKHECMNGGAGILCEDDEINVNSNYNDHVVTNTVNDQYSDIPKENDKKSSKNKENGVIDYNYNINISDEDDLYKNKTKYESEDIFNYEDSDKSYSSSNGTPADGTYDYDISDSEDSCIQDEINVLGRGIHNPNYPGFQHLAYTLQDYPSEIPEGYESTLFSDVYINCKNEEELIKLTLANQQYNKIHLENNLNDYDCSDDEGISTKFNDLEDSDCIRDISSDSAIYEIHDVDYSQQDTLKYSSPIPTPDDSKAINLVCSAPDDELVSLRHEIYDTLQKPLESMIESVSEVINTVVRHIVEHQSKHETDIWNSLLELNLESNTENINEDSSINNKGIEDENDITTSGYDSISEKLDSVLDIKDAYITSVKEDLFESPDFEKYICSKKYLKHENLVNGTTFVKEEPKNNNASVSYKNTYGVKNKTISKKQMYSNESDKKKDEKCSRKMGVDKNNEQDGSSSKVVEVREEFDVYNIETAMPHIDLDIIENHLRAAREEERRRRNDREEIRRRLALGGDGDDCYRHGEKPGRKPSLQRRLQNGMNLQICFMNETASDVETPLDGETGEENIIKDGSHKTSHHLQTTSSKFKSSSSTNNNKGAIRPSTLPLSNITMAPPNLTNDLPSGVAFLECQARLQTEARMALAQAKELARMQMEMDRSKQNISPITEMLRNGLLKAGVKLNSDRRRVSRQILTDMNVTQLQVIVNELHTQIEYLNEGLVKYLITRDELHMEQDSMLVDIEDLTRYLSAKQVPSKDMDDNFVFSENLKQCSLSSLLHK